MGKKKKISISDITDDFTKWMTDKNSEQLEEFFVKTSHEEQFQLFKNLKDQLQTTIESQSHHIVRDEERDPQEDNEQKDKIYQTAIQFIGEFCTLTENFIKEKSRIAPEPLQDAVAILHDVIFEINANGDKWSTNATTKIVEICETWWRQDRVGKESIAPQTISLLLVKALDVGGKVQDVQRVYDMRSALLLIDFADERMLLRCLIHPLFLKNKKGNLFLVYLFGLFPPFIDELHNTIKAQIHSGRKSILEVYGDVYYKAWKTASGPYLLKIEYSCIQDLMSSCIHVADTKISTAIRTILGVFHGKKKQKGVDSMLVKLYEPILWRNLNVANPVVRRNATSLLMEAFPLQDPEARQIETDALLQKQFTALESLLYDESVAVRCIAVTGVCRVLGVYWELIPEHTIRVLLAHIVNDLAHDSSSSNVRAAVLEGLRYLLDNHLSHPVLRALLPTLSALLHDNAEKVRLEFVLLLSSVKPIKSIKFYEISPVEHLLARLAIDPPVSKKITELLINSYFPHTKEGSEQVKRCLVLVKANPKAAEIFYSRVPTIAPISAVVKFLGYLHKYLIKSIRKKQEKENVNDSTIQEDTTLETLISIQVTLWSSISEELSQKVNQQLQKYLYELFTDESFDTLLNYFTSVEARNSIFQLASHLPKENIPQFSKNCIKQLQQLKKLQIEQFEHLIECLFAWDFGDQVLDLLSSWINLPFSESSSAKRSTKKSKKSKENSENNETKVLLAFKLLSNLMGKETTRNSLLTYTNQATNILKVLLDYFIPIQTKLANENAELSDEVLSSALACYCKFFIHLSAYFDEMEKDPDALVDLVRWCKEDLLSAISQTEASDAFVWNVCETTIRIFTECVTFGFCTTMLQNQIIEIAEKLIENTKCSKAFYKNLLPCVFKLIYQLYSQSEFDSATKILLSIFVHCPKEYFSEENSKLVRLNEILALHQQQRSLDSFLEQLLPVLFHEIEVPEKESDLCSKFEHLPSIPAFLLSTIQRSNPSITTLASLLNQVLSANSNIDTIWKTLEILSVLIQNQPKKKLDYSPLQNILISLISKLPDKDLETTEDQEADLPPSYVKSLANSLLKQSYANLQAVAN